jgi:hypothetical protein
MSGQVNGINGLRTSARSTILTLIYLKMKILKNKEK